MESDVCGVGVDQIAEAISLDAELGVHADYNPRTGAVIWTSPEHRRNWCRAHGFYDKNGGYRDPERGWAREKGLPYAQRS
jgi:hypothetical protein